jgi:transposase-like protein
MEAYEPESLQEAIRYFSDFENCKAYVVARRWPNGITCPTCSSKDVKWLPNQRRWYCANKHPKRQFSLKTGTIFEESPIGLDKWLPTIWLLANCKNGISSYEVATDINVSQRTAWFMLHRIRYAMREGAFEKMCGEVEADETFIGGLARFMHKNRRDKVIKGTGGSGKVAVMGLLERHGKDKISRVRATVVPNVKRRSLHEEIRGHVETGSTVYSDALKSYEKLDPDYEHKVIDHAEAYVKGHVHTNGIENFWSLLKRCLKGTYVSVEPFHLYRYIDEQAFRFNARKETPETRFSDAVLGVTGRRLTYKQLTGEAGS